MNIFKAFLLTALLIAIELLLYFGLYKFIEPQVKNHISSENFTHYLLIQHLLAQIISYLTMFFLFFRTNLKWNKGIDKIKTLRLRTIFFIIIVAIGLELFDRPFFDFSKIMDYLMDVEPEAFRHSERSSTILLLNGIGVIIIAPIFEELFFRKFLFTELQKKYSLNLSILISSICFAIVHLPNYGNLIPVFILGILSCIIYNRTKNILYSMILHFFSNSSWLFFIGAYGKSYHNWILGLEYNYMYWAMFGIGIFLTFFGLKKITTANNTSYEKP